LNAVRGIVRDLVERKLWPVAVALLIVAVAVPVWIGRSSSDDAVVAPPLPAVQDGAQTASRAAVKVSDDTTAKVERPGKVRNPFRQLHVPEAASPATTTTTTTQSAPATPPAPTGGGSSLPVAAPVTPSTGTGTGTTTPAAPQTDALDTYHVSLRVGVTTKPLRSIHELPRLSPLPSANDPFFVYMGVLRDGKTASFLLSSDATATGDGKCLPIHTSCQTVELKEGDTVFFDVNGSGVQYQMDLVHITKHTSGTVTAAAASLERHSTFGAALLRDAHKHGDYAFAASDMYRFLPETGLVARLKRSVVARSSDAGSHASAQATDVGEPVWHWRLGGSFGRP
jgi:hypothetical protein